MDKVFFVTGECRMLFCDLKAPRASEESKPKFGVGVLILKSAAWLADFRKAYQAVVKAAWPDKTPKLVELVKDCDSYIKEDGTRFVEEYPVSAGHFLMRAKSQFEPKLWLPDGSKSDPLAPEWYAGAWVRLKVQLKSYAPSASFPQSKYGVSAYLQSMMFARHDEPLSSGGGGGGGAADFGVATKAEEECPF